MPYNVALDSFHGPLDLLLYLVRKHEVDVLDIPIAQLADQFSAHVQAIRGIDIEFAGDFIVMTATLMLIKSQMLVKEEQHEETQEQADPRRELVKQLLEYRKFKDAASALEERAEEQGTRVPRLEMPEPSASSGPVVKPVELWDLVSAFARLMRETQSMQAVTIAVDDTPQHIYEAQIKDRVARESRVPFVDVFTRPLYKAKLIGIFLAVLELIRHRGIGLEMGDAEKEIWLVPFVPPPEDELHEPPTETATQPGGTTAGGLDSVPSGGLPSS